jgi:hypothetical protein
MRHIKAINEGELIDEESNIPHIGLAMCNLMFLSHFHQKAKIKDHQKGESQPPY